MNNNEQKRSEYIPFREFQKIIGLKYRSAYALAESAQIKTLTTPSGQRLYNRQSIIDYINDHTNLPQEEQKQPKHNFVYCRVSSKKQEDDLQRQIRLAKSSFPDFQIISDIGSGINWKRKGLKTILGCAIKGNIGELVVFHRDRLSRFAFGLIEFIIKTTGGKITIVNNDSEKSSEQELSEDLMSIVHIFSCKQMGKRRYKQKPSIIEDS